jgi:hypothetical protein
MAQTTTLATSSSTIDTLFWVDNAPPGRVLPAVVTIGGEYTTICAINGPNLSIGGGAYVLARTNPTAACPDISGRGLGTPGQMAHSAGDVLAFGIVAPFAITPATTVWITPRVNVSLYLTATNTLADAVALAEAALPATGGTIVVPPGTYVTPTLVLTKPTALLCAAGQQTVITAGSSGSSIISATNISNVSITNCVLTASLSSPRWINGITLTDISNFDVRGVSISNIPGNAVAITRGTVGIIGALNLTDIKYAGIRLDTGGVGENSYIRIEDSVITRPNRAAVGGNAGIQAAGNAYNHHLQITNVTISDSGTVGIGLDSIAASTIRQCSIARCGGECIAIDGHDVDIDSNTINSCGSSGIMLYATMPISGNVTISNNNVTDGNSMGIGFVWGTNNITMQNVFVFNNVTADSGKGNQRFGIQSYLAGGVINYDWTGVYVFNNDLSKNALAPFNLTLGSKVRFNHNKGWDY